MEVEFRGKHFSWRRLVTNAPCPWSSESSVCLFFSSAFARKGLSFLFFFIPGLEFWGANRGGD